MFNLKKKSNEKKRAAVLNKRFFPDSYSRMDKSLIKIFCSSKRSMFPEKKKLLQNAIGAGKD